MSAPAFVRIEGTDYVRGESQIVCFDPQGLKFVASVMAFLRAFPEVRVINLTTSTYSQLESRLNMLLTEGESLSMEKREFAGTGLFQQANVLAIIRLMKAKKLKPAKRAAANPSNQA